MKNPKDYEIYRYYKGEEKNPFYGENRVHAMWWDGEKMYHETQPDFKQRVKDQLLDAIKKNELSGPLLNEKLSLEVRSIIFFLDLWHGKWFPYDDKDLIFEY